FRHPPECLFGQLADGKLLGAQRIADFGNRHASPSESDSSPPVQGSVSGGRFCSSGRNAASSFSRAGITSGNRSSGTGGFAAAASAFQSVIPVSISVVNIQSR